MGHAAEWFNAKKKTNRIGPKDNTTSALTKLAEGNSGAMDCLVLILRKNDWYGGVHSLAIIKRLDEIGLYGAKLNKLWNEHCNRNLDQLEVMLRNHKAVEELLKGED